MPRATVESKRRGYAQVRAKKREFMRAAKSRPCADCKVPYPYYVMDFDHVRGEKLFNLGYYQKFSLPNIISEIAKCDVVCANCHREREYKRFQTAPPTL